MAASTAYLGTGIGAAATFTLVKLHDKLAHVADSASSAIDMSPLYFYPLCFVSLIAWIAVVAAIMGLRLKNRSSYMHLAGDDDTNFSTPRRRHSALDNSPKGSDFSLDKVKSAFEETFRVMNRFSSKRILSTPRPHFRMIRSILPHYFHGYTADGHVVIWEFLGQIKMDKLHSSGFTTVDLSDHYQFFLQFAVEKLLKTSSQKLVYVIDLEGLTLMDTDERIVETATSIIGVLIKEFPDRMHRLAVLNAPVWFSQVMTSVRPHLSKRTTDRIMFIQKETVTEDLLKLIGVDSLPRRYGGQNNVEIGKSSQERALDELLKQTTGHLEETIEIVGAQSRRIRSGSARSDDIGSDEEAFFDCSEYGLQDEDLDEGEDISIVVHSQMMKNDRKDTEPKILPHLTPRQHTNEKKMLSRDANIQAVNVSDHWTTGENIVDIALSNEPYACLVLSVFFLWSLIQFSFDEIYPLWFFKGNPITLGLVSSGTNSANVLSITLSITGSLALTSLTLLACQLVISTFSSNLMTPLATLRLGLLFQIPVVGCFPLIDVFHVDRHSFAWIIVTIATFAKHITAGVALHGLLSLMDNSIAVDRRLAVHRAACVVSYAASFFSSATGPAWFALMGYFAKSFPFDQSLLYLVQGLGLAFLFFFSLLIPTRLNFPMLLSMSKR